MNTELEIAVKAAADPAKWAWPVTLPIEIALHTATVKELCAEYSISHDEWMQIKENPAFQAEVANAVEALRKDGMDFKMRAQLQSKELLKRVWEMTHHDFAVVPANVQADLIKFMIKAAGLDASKDQGAQGNDNRTAFQININL